jgi:hypothetical protein
MTTMCCYAACVVALRPTAGVLECSCVHPHVATAAHGQPPSVSVGHSYLTGCGGGCVGCSEGGGECSKEVCIPIRSVYVPCVLVCHRTSKPMIQNNTRIHCFHVSFITPYLCITLYHWYHTVSLFLTLHLFITKGVSVFYVVGLCCGE